MPGLVPVDNGDRFDEPVPRAGGTQVPVHATLDDGDGRVDRVMSVLILSVYDRS